MSHLSLCSLTHPPGPGCLLWLRVISASRPRQPFLTLPPDQRPASTDWLGHHHPSSHLPDSPTITTPSCVENKQYSKKTMNSHILFSINYICDISQTCPLLFTSNSSPSRSSRSSLTPALPEPDPVPPFMPIMERLDSVDWARDIPTKKWVKIEKSKLNQFLGRESGLAVAWRGGCVWTCGHSYSETPAWSHVMSSNCHQTVIKSNCHSGPNSRNLGNA